MNIIRNFRFHRSSIRQCLYFCSKGCQESKKCESLKATSECSKGGGRDKCDEGKKKNEVKRVTLIQGDGVGKELVGSLQEVFEVAKVPVQWDVFCEHKDKKTEKVLPDVLESLLRNEVGIKGPIRSHNWYKDLRKTFDLYAYVAVCKNLAGQENPYGRVDCTIVRDIMEGEYSGIEHSVVPGVVQSIKVSTAFGAQRVARFVFQYAKEHKRKNITVAHKANIMALTDGNFLKEMRDEANNHMEEIMFEERYMDTACLNLIMNPELTDVLVSSSMYGDVLVMVASSIMGGKSLCPGFAVSTHGRLFDTLNKPNVDLAGKDVINPTAILLSSVLMLKHLKLMKHAEAIKNAVKSVYMDTDIRTVDVGGKAKTSEFTKAVCDKLNESKSDTKCE